MKQVKGRTVKSILLFLVMLLVAVICLFPFYTMIMMSTHVTENIYKGKLPD